MDNHVQSYKTDIYKKSVISMVTKLYDKMSAFFYFCGAVAQRGPWPPHS